MSEKLKILVVHPNTGGCAYYRSIMPYQKLLELHSDKVEIRFNDNPLKLDLKTSKFEYPGAEEGKAPEDIQWAHVVLINNIKIGRAHV